MKQPTTLQWVLIGIVAALIIACVVCYFFAPKFTFFVSGITIGALAGFIGGYFTCKKYALH